MKNIIFFFIVVLGTSLYGECKRADGTHANKDVLRCKYYQEDIHRCYNKKLYCYPELQRRNQCFFCECPIEEHAKQPEQSLVVPKKPKKLRRW